MNRSTLRIGITVLTLITAIIHLIILNIGFMREGSPDLLFTLNGLGYLVLLYVLLRPPAFLVTYEQGIHYLFILFTAVTIVIWVFIGARGILAYVTKIVEALLIVALVMHLRTEAPAEA